MYDVQVLLADVLGAEVLEVLVLVKDVLKVPLVVVLADVLEASNC